MENDTLVDMAKWKIFKSGVDINMLKGSVCVEVNPGPTKRASQLGQKLFGEGCLLGQEFMNAVPLPNVKGCVHGVQPHKPQDC